MGGQINKGRNNYSRGLLVCHCAELAIAASGGNKIFVGFDKQLPDTRNVQQGAHMVFYRSC